MRPSVLLGAFLATTVAVLVTCNACSNAGTADGGADTAAEAPADARQDRNTLPKDVSLPDADPGWRYFMELQGCDAQVPVDPQLSMKKLTWIACPSGKAECQRFDTTGWREDMLPGVINSASISGDKQWLAFVRPLSGGKSAEWDLYDRINLSPVNAWLWSGDCDVVPILGVSRVTLLGILFATSSYAYANGALPTTALKPTFVTFQPQPKYQWVRYAASDTKIAFEVNAGLGIDTVDAGDTTFTSAPGKKWFDPFVVGTDVFVWNEYGATGWSRELRVNGDGSSTVLREVQGRHVSRFRSDGVSWFWVEAYGDSNFQNFAQPFAEVWTAPYTNNPATLTSTAKKLVQVDGVAAGNGNEAAFDGHYAVPSAPNGTLYVVRASDGALKTIDIPTLYGPGPMGVSKLRMQQLAFVSKDEVWGVLCGLQGSPSNLGFAKFALGSWP